MKILYGVQATGNGHISRSRKMAAHFRARGVDVTFLLSGRPREQLFDMACFGEFEHRAGLTMSLEQGRVGYIKTVTEAQPLTFMKDVHALSLDRYDLIVSDFEPVTAWAARTRGRTCIGIGHQYAFRHAVPKVRGNPLANSVLRWFAPADIAVGLHWHHFDTEAFPPIIDTRLARRESLGERYILVYLPFEDQARVTRLLQGLSQHRFVQYAPTLNNAENGNVSLRKTCLDGFRHDLTGASAVICNAGFELVSECFHIGLPVLVKAVAGQVEQLSNALALRRLGWGQTVEELEADALGAWLASARPSGGMRYPDVAGALVDWLLAGEWRQQADLWEALWSCTRTTSVGGLQPQLP